MKLRPVIKPYDWIYVDRWTTALVTSVRELDDPYGDCEVVFDASNPTSGDVRWTGYEWAFREDSLSENAERYPRLQPFVRALRDGRRVPEPAQVRETSARL
jgi:hypothetical protein